MRINITNIPDVTKPNIVESKLKLADDLIKGIAPLLDEVYLHKKKEVDLIKVELKNNRKKINEQKEELDELMKDYSRKKKISNLLVRVSKIVNSGLAYQGSTKHEIVVLLRVINKLSEAKLDEYLKSTMNTISKRLTNH